MDRRQLFPLAAVAPVAFSDVFAALDSPEIRKRHAKFVFAVDPDKVDYTGLNMADLGIDGVIVLVCGMSEPIQIWRLE